MGKEVTQDSSCDEEYWAEVSEAVRLTYWDPALPYPRFKLVRVLDERGLEFFKRVRPDIERVERIANEIDPDPYATEIEVAALVGRTLTSEMPCLSQACVKAVATAYAFYWFKGGW